MPFFLHFAVLPRCFGCLFLPARPGRSDGVFSDSSFNEPNLLEVGWDRGQHGEVLEKVRIFTSAQKNAASPEGCSYLVVVILKHVVTSPASVRHVYCFQCYSL